MDAGLAEAGGIVRASCVVKRADKLLDMGSGPLYTWDVPGEESSDRWAVNF